MSLDRVGPEIELKIIKILSLGLLCFVVGLNFPLETQSSSISPSPPVLETLNSDIQQVLMVDASSGSSKADLTVWEKRQNHWQSVFESMPAVVGRNGVVSSDQKKEGDGHTPSGIYALGTAFGYAPTVLTKLSYRPVTTHDFWVDDPTSIQYNRWVTDTPHAKSFERLKREDDLYKYAVVIEYNTNPVVPGKGSAIFLHVWRDFVTPTAGCVALSEENIVRLLSWLDHSRHPVIIITPSAKESSVQ